MAHLFLHEVRESLHFTLPLKVGVGVCTVLSSHHIQLNKHTVCIPFFFTSFENSVDPNLFIRIQKFLSIQMTMNPYFLDHCIDWKSEVLTV